MIFFKKLITSNMSIEKKYLLVILGPTAVGKTNLTLQLAQELKAEIISCDSRQMYQKMNIGTAKPSEEELQLVRHHFIDNLTVTDEYNAGKFEKDALLKIESLHKKNNIVLMAGGSGLYINAVCYGFDDLPKVDASLKHEWIQNFEEKGLEFLQAKVIELDKNYFENLSNDEQKNPQRLIRMIGLMLTSGKKMSDLKKISSKNKRPFECIMIGLNIDRTLLYNRINQRVDEMIENGLENEVKKLLPFSKHNSMKTVGYQEVASYLNNEYDLEEAIRLIKRNSRRYAKRQMTWFRKDKNVKWFHPKEYENILNFIKKKMSLKQGLV